MANGEVVGRATAIAFQGALNPFLLFVAIPALFAAAARAWRDADELDLVALAWFAGTIVPFTLQAVFQDRTTYLYYLLVTLPALVHRGRAAILGARRPARGGGRVGRCARDRIRRPLPVPHAALVGGLTRRAIRAMLRRSSSQATAGGGGLACKDGPAAGSRAVAAPERPSSSSPSSMAARPTR